jgi:hypothetical protein
MPKYIAAESIAGSLPSSLAGGRYAADRRSWSAIRRARDLARHVHRAVGLAEGRAVVRWQIRSKTASSSRRITLRRNAACTASHGCNLLWLYHVARRSLVPPFPERRHSMGATSPGSAHLLVEGPRSPRDPRASHTILAVSPSHISPDAHGPRTSPDEAGSRAAIPDLPMIWRGKFVPPWDWRKGVR